MTKWMTVICVTCTVAALSSTARGQGMAYGAGAWPYGEGCDTSGSPVPVSALCQNSGGCAGTGGLYATSDGQSTNARLHASTQQLRYGGWNSCGGGWRSGARASWQFPVIFTGPPGEIQVPSAINVPFRATFTNIPAGTAGSVGASFSVVVFMGDYGGNPSGLFSMGENPGLAGDVGAPGPTNINFNITGPHSIEAIGHQRGVFHWGWGNVALNVVYLVNISVSVNMHNGDFGSGSQDCDADIWAEFGSGPVFELPPGYNVNSTDGRIVNNQWISPLPVITQQPQSVGTCPGENVQLTVTATGTGTLSYQWKKDNVALVNGPTGNGSTIGGATTNTLSITNIAAADLGSYVVDVTNSDGTRTSNPANVSQTCVIVTDETTQAYLDGLTTLPSSLLMIDEDARPTLIVPNLTQVGGRVEVQDNDSLTTVDAALLATINGGLLVADNPLLTALSMPLLTSVGGNMTLSGITGGTIPPRFPSLAHIGGDLNLTHLCVIPEFDSLNVISASFTFDNNCEIFSTVIMSLVVVDLGGSVVITNNDSPHLGFTVLSSVGSDVTITNNDNPQVDLGGLGTVGGDVTVTNNSNPQVDLGGLVTVGGDVTLESNNDVDLSGVAVGGNTDVSTNGANSVEVAAPGGTTSVAMTNDGGSVDSDLPDDAVPAGTPFAVLHVSGAGLDPQTGLDATGAPASVDPVAAYSFNLGGTLAAPASLVFEVILANLSPAEQTAVLDAYTAGQLTLTVKSDAPNSVPQARPQCGPSDPLVVDGCVKVGAFDALGFELAPGVTTGAVKLRIAVLVSHFSTYAMSIVTPLPTGDCNCDGSVTPDDVPAFVLGLIDPDAYAVQYPNCPIMQGNVNSDSAVDGQDIQPFVNLVVTP